MLITAGERKATALVCMALHDLGVTADSFTGSQAGFITDTNHMNAKILEVRADRVRDAVAAGRVPVVGGSQGVSTDRDVTFFGRGGSDTTAVALAEALGGVCELYTDVSGVFTTDPRVVPDRPADEPHLLRRDARDVRRRLPEAGDARRRVRPHPRRAAARAVQLHLGAGHLDHRGGPRTWSRPSCRASSGDDSEAKVTITGVPDRPGIAATLFRGLADADINVDMIVQNVSEHGITDISFTLPKDDLDQADARSPRRCRRASAPPACRATPRSRR